MLAQLHTSERQNAVLKSKLEASKEAEEQYRLLAVDKEKQLQTTIVYLSAAQVGITTTVTTITTTTTTIATTTVQQQLPLLLLTIHY